MGGTLNLAILPTFGMRWLVPRLPEFARLHPEVRRMARALYTGAYRDLDKAHRELARWAREQGLEPAGPPWEIHTTGPSDVSDAASAKAQLYLPVRPAKAG